MLFIHPVFQPVELLVLRLFLIYCGVICNIIIINERKGKTKKKKKQKTRMATVKKYRQTDLFRTEVG